MVVAFPDLSAGGVVVGAAALILAIWPPLAGALIPLAILLWCVDVGAAVVWLVLGGFD